MQLLDKLKIILGSIVLSSTLVSFSAYADNSCRQDLEKCAQFYSRHSHFEDLVILIDANHEFGSKQPLQSFATLDFYKNPEHKKQAVNQFQSFSPKVQQIFLNALIANKTNVNDLAKKFHLTPEKTLTPIELQNLKINDNAANLDTLWSAYQATGDIIYPSKILEYITDNDDYFLKLTAYFFMGVEACPPGSIAKNDCRLLPIKQIKKDLENRYPAEANTIFHHLATVSSALWSVNAMRKQDPILNQKLFAVCRANPKLDYLKKTFPGNTQGWIDVVPLQSGI